MTKIGRPKKDDALTDAERQKQYRERKKAKRASGELDQTPAQYRARIKKLELELIDAKSTIAALQPSLMRANEQVLDQQRRVDELDARVEQTQVELGEAWDYEEKASKELSYILGDVAELVRRANGGDIAPREVKELLRRYEFDYEEWLESYVDMERDD